MLQNIGDCEYPILFACIQFYVKKVFYFLFFKENKKDGQRKRNRKNVTGLYQYMGYFVFLLFCK